MPTVTLPDGTQAEATAVDFEDVEVSWDEYRLDDGSTMKIKLVVNGVYRLEDQYNEMGEPIYVTQSDNQVRVLDIDDELLADEAGVVSGDRTSDRGVQ